MDLTEIKAHLAIKWMTDTDHRRSTELLRELVMEMENPHSGKPPSKTLWCIHCSAYQECDRFASPDAGPNYRCCECGEEVDDSPCMRPILGVE